LRRNLLRHEVPFAVSGNDSQHQNLLNWVPMVKGPF